MVSSAAPERRVVTSSSGETLTAIQLRDRAAAAARYVKTLRAQVVVFIGENSPAFPLSLFAAAGAAIPFLPLNYRLAADRLSELVERQGRVALISDVPSLGEL